MTYFIRQRKTISKIMENFMNPNITRKIADIKKYSHFKERKFLMEQISELVDYLLEIRGELEDDHCNDVNENPAFGQESIHSH